jgi:hypothetical protein
MKLTDKASKAAREFSGSVIGLSDKSEAALAGIIRKHFPESGESWFAIKLKDSFVGQLYVSRASAKHVAKHFCASRVVKIKLVEIK